MIRRIIKKKNLNTSESVENPDPGSTLTILDADCFIFQSAWAVRDQMNMLGLMAAKNKLDSLISAVLEKCNTDYYLGFYGIPDTKNFRYEVATIQPYKGTRSSTDEEWVRYFKPLLKNYMGERWGFYGLDEIEADDAVSIAFKKYKDIYKIKLVFEDKDLKQLAYFNNCDIIQYNPNRKHNPNGKLETITVKAGMKSFYLQTLHGDGTDNIAGVQGLGKAGALKLINNLELSKDNNATELDYFNLVQDQYIKKYADGFIPFMVENFLLLKMLTKPLFGYPENIVLRKFIKVEHKIQIIDI